MNEYDILLFTETWNSKCQNVDISEYEHVSCSRPKFNRKAKRHSGGVLVFYKDRSINMLEVVDLNCNGIIWFKLKKEFFGNDRDLFLCCCYIPPEGSSVYKNANSSLYDFDFFDQLNCDIVKYRYHGDVYITGDLNSRIGIKADFVSDIHLDRYIDLPNSDLHV